MSLLPGTAKSWGTEMAVDQTVEGHDSQVEVSTSPASYVWWVYIMTDRISKHICQFKDYHCGWMWYHIYVEYFSICKQMWCQQSEGTTSHIRLSRESGGRGDQNSSTVRGRGMGEEKGEGREGRMNNVACILRCMPHYRVIIALIASDACLCTCLVDRFKVCMHHLSKRDQRARVLRAEVLKLQVFHNQKFTSYNHRNFCKQ